LRRVRERVEEMADFCDTEVMLEVVGGKWKLLILKFLLQRTHRFCELQRALPPITQRMLTRQLRELEADGLVRRTVYAEVPPKVEYDLTEVGRTLEGIIEQLNNWGRWYRDHLKAQALPEKEAVRPTAPHSAQAARTPSDGSYCSAGG
jgi:DNA-binding HxlR family transcriptional regulator